MDMINEKSGASMNTKHQFKDVNTLSYKRNLISSPPLFEAVIENPYMTWIWFLDRKQNKKPPCKRNLS